MRPSSRRRRCPRPRQSRPRRLPPHPRRRPSSQRVTLVFSGEVLSHGPVIRSGGGRRRARSGVRLPAHVRRGAAAPRGGRSRGLPRGDAGLGRQRQADGLPDLQRAARDAGGLAAPGTTPARLRRTIPTTKGPAGCRHTRSDGRRRLCHTGMARTAEERDAQRCTTWTGSRVGHSVVHLRLNGFVLPADQPYLVNVTTVDAVLADAAAAKAAGR